MLAQDDPYVRGLRDFQGRKVVFADHWKVLPEGLTDRFTGALRRKCRVADQPGRECTNYPIVQCMNILRFFKPKRWLDPTMGWGDRLLCAMAMGIEYVGTDTNTALHAAYDRIAALDASVKVSHTAVPFQDFVLPRKKFDLVFTSPPFGSFEVYEGMEDWNNVDVYLTKFLFPLLAKSSKALRKGGHLVLYIEDKPGARFIDRMLDYGAKLPLEFLGVIYYQGLKPRPHYVWKNV